MRLYHAVDRWHEVACIRENGFSNRADTFFAPPRAGVQLVDRPEFLTGRYALEVEIAATDFELTHFEMVEDGKPYREWLVPATWLNRRAAAVAVVSPPAAHHEMGAEDDANHAL